MNKNLASVPGSGNYGSECVNDTLFIEALLVRASTWPDAISRRINIAEARRQAKPAFEVVPVPASLDQDDAKGTLRRQYEVAISGNQEINILGDVTSAHYEISLHHNRDGFIFTRDGYPIFGARFVILQRLTGDGIGHSYILGYNFS